MEEIIFSGNKERLDIFLVTHFNHPRNFFHHIIARGGILVNGKQAKKSYKLKDGDKVQIDDLKRFLSDDIVKDFPFVDLEVKLEKEDYMVIYKPKGVLSHPNSVWDLKNPSVVGFLYHKFKDLPSVGSFVRSGIIHRLDKDTDGFMIVVKTEKGLAYFKELFNQKSMAETIEDKDRVPLKKYYRATVNVTEEGQKFLDSINEFPYIIEQLVKPKVPYYGDPKMGITKLISYDSVKCEEGGVKLDGIIQNSKFKIQNLNMEILTGRTHQIRYHLSEAGLPIVGDKLYGLKEDIDMCLTAYKLEFLDLNQDEIIIE